MPSDLKFAFDGSETTTDASLLLGTARATLHVIPITQPVWLSVAAA